MMSLLLESLLKNAEAAQLEAGTSDLPKVRERAARAAATWEAMAERLQRVEAMKRP